MFVFIEAVNKFVWGVPALFMILWVGILLTLKTGFLQIRLFPNALKQFFLQFKGRKESEGEISPYRALCTALAATVGTGNLAGVAGAIALGGPGAVFWLWVSGFVGMITKFAEIVLSMRYRYVNERGEYVGGPMITIVKGLKTKWHYLAYVYAFFGVVASFGVGNATQVNTVINGFAEVMSSFGFPFDTMERLLVAAGIALLLLILLLGGAKKIAQAAEFIVPIAAGFYILLCLTVLVLTRNTLPHALRSIFIGAFSPEAVTGGMIGSSFTALRIGAARGVFTNEAGMGTASIAHASACGNQPIQQGLMGIMEVFIDTIVICTMTALVILCSGVVVPYGTDIGIRLTSQAFTAVYGKWVNIPIALALSSFAFATILGWSLYGLRCAQFLFGYRVWNFFVMMQITVVIIGAILKTQTVWLVSEIVNGLMSIPNLIAIFLLMPELLHILRIYEKFGTDLRSRNKSIE
ncbi:MAG: sodium:alanine symporter family protein [Oscillospiraceae bacterium]|nr:sodium:alanine symporter family protein [Oscillospiraceae bacterium]